MKITQKPKIGEISTGGGYFYSLKDGISPGYGGFVRLFISKDMEVEGQWLNAQNCKEMSIALFEWYLYLSGEEV